MDTSQLQEQTNFTLASPDILGQQVLDLMIDELLIRQESEKRGITVSTDEIEKNIQRGLRLLFQWHTNPNCRTSYDKFIIIHSSTNDDIRS